MRVFCDRIVDQNDENWVKKILVNSIINNFCTDTDYDTDYEKSNDSYKDNSTNQNESLSNTLAFDPKPKKVVTFKAGLINERNFKPYKGVLITKEQVNNLI